MATEYIFFAEDLRDRFVALAEQRGLPCQSRPDALEGYVVALPDHLADEHAAALEAAYDLLMDEQKERVESDDVADAREVLGIAVTLADDRPCLVRLPAALARRLLQHFSTDEIHTIVAAVVDSVENPIDGPLCHPG
jgi:hypothetical protein